MQLGLEGTMLRQYVDCALFSPCIYLRADWSA